MIKKIFSVLMFVFVLCACNNNDSVPAEFVGTWATVATTDPIRQIVLRSDKTGTWKSSSKGIITGEGDFTWNVKGDKMISSYEDGTQESENYTLTTDTLTLSKVKYIRQ